MGTRRGLVVNGMPGVQHRADGGAGVPRRRLHEDALE